MEAVRYQIKNRYKSDPKLENGLPNKRCSRPSRWGNEYKTVEVEGRWWIVDKYNQTWGFVDGYDNKEDATKEAVRLFEQKLKRILATKVLNISELKNHNLGCYCKLGETCHLDVLLKLANE